MRARTILGAHRVAKRLLVATAICAVIAAALFFVPGRAQEESPDATPVAAEAMRDKLLKRQAAGTAKGTEGERQNEPPTAAPDEVLAVASAANYNFVTATDGSLTDMSTGTTTLLGADIDDTASPLTNITFDFYFMGTRFTQFSINDNGVLRLGAAAQTGSPYQPLAQASIPIITAYGADQRTVATTGRVHYKVIGVAPNRTLVIQWLNMQANFNAGGAANLTYQVRLSETTGVIEFVYGSMTMSTAGAADPNSNDPHIGFSSSNTAGTVGSVTAPQAGTPTYNGMSADPVENLYTAGPITVLTSAAQGSRRRMTFTPPVPTAPTNLTFTGIGPAGMTLNWTDSPDEVIYAIYRSTDGINYTFASTAPMNATSFAATGLNPSTNYFWQVYAVSEGALSAALSGSQMTDPPGTITSVNTGLWSAGTTWSGGVPPTANDNVVIASGHTVTINSSDAFSVTVQSGGILQFEATTVRTLTVVTNVTIDSGGIFQTAATGTVTTHNLSVGGNLTNNGTLDFSTNANTAGARITFTGAANNTFSGTGATTDVRTITINKGTSNANILELTTSAFTVQGATTDTVTANYLTLINGTFKLSGTFTAALRTFTGASYTIPATAGIWLNNPNYTVSGQGGSLTQNGLMRISQGTYNVGTASGNSISGTTGVYTIEGGTLNIAGRLELGSSAVYTQSGGVVNITTVGNASSSFAGFDALSTAVLNMSGGTINLVRANTSGTPNDWWVDAPINFIGVGTTVNAGTAATITNFNFRMRGNVPNLVIDNTTNNKSVTFAAQTIIYGNVTVNTGTTYNLNGFLVALFGEHATPTFTNNGTVVGTGVSRFYFAPANPLTYTGTGVAGTNAAPLASIEFDSVPGSSVTFDPSVTNNLVTNTVRLFTGNVINSNKIQLGTGGGSTSTVQIGNGTTATDAGTFSHPFTFNLGTGGQVLLYLRTVAHRNTGPEINPSRILTSLTYDNNTANVTLVGGDVTLTSTGTALTLTTGIFFTSGTTVILSSGTATVTRTTGYVFGGLQKAYTSTGSKLFEVGTTNGYSPATVNVTALNANPSSIRISLEQFAHPVLNPTTSLDRFWRVTEIGDVQANLTFNYQSDALDVNGNEANYRVIKVEGGVPFSFPEVCPAGPCVNEATNTITVPDVTSFSDWTAGEPDAPTSSPANIAGRVLTNTGLPLAGVTMTLLDTVLVETRTTVTDANGDYQFNAILTGRDVVVTPMRSGYVFNPQHRAFGHTAEVNNINFTATPDGTGTRHTPHDFDGDGRADLSVWRPADGTFYIMQSGNGVMRAEQWGTTGDRIATADFDGDHKTDVAVFRPSNGTWYIKQSSNGVFRSVQWGLGDDVIVPADYDGDGQGDVAVWRPATGAWYILQSATGQVQSLNWGTTGDKPVLADYDNDGKADVAVFRPSTGIWYIRRSSDGEQRTESWGLETDRPVVGDYDADGKADLAVFRPGTGVWHLRLSSDNSIQTRAHGAGAAVLVPADYDGDGKVDVGVWQQESGAWSLLRSTTSSVTSHLWGTGGDVPVPSAFIQ